MAARRLLENVHELPKKLIEELRSALNAEEELGPEKNNTAKAITRRVWP
jgi:hypothetical protein